MRDMQIYTNEEYLNKQKEFVLKAKETTFEAV